MDRLEQARDPNTPAATLAELAGDKDAEVRGWVARHPRTSANHPPPRHG